MAETFSNPFAKGSSITDSFSRNPAGQQDVNKIEDLLNDDTDDTKETKEEKKLPPPKEDKEEEPEEETKEETKEDETEDEEEDKEDKIELKEDEEDEEKEEKLEIKEESIDVPPKKLDITKKYPNFFKDFPFFDRMMFRDKAYTEMFGSFDEAKEVAGKVERLNEFETQLLSGDMRDVLTTVKSTDPKAFDKIVDTFLKQLYEVDKDAYEDVTNNFAKIIIHGMATEAKKKNNVELDKAAKALHEYLFNTDQWEDLKVRAPETKSSEQEKLDKERADFLNQRFTVARDGLTVKVDNILKATINQYIDPKEQMSAYEKRYATQQALDKIHAKIAEDKTFRNQLNRLWKNSASNNFNEETLGQIKKAYLGRANSDKLLASVIKEIRNEVLKDKRTTSKKKDDEEETTSTSETRERRKNVNAGGPHQQKSKANERKPGETVEEFIGRD